MFNQMNDHMVMNALYPVLQSSYRKQHSTETALLKVMNDIILKMNSQHVTLLVKLDLSAAFDTLTTGYYLIDYTTKLAFVEMRLTGLNLIDLIEASVP